MTQVGGQSESLLARVAAEPYAPAGAAGLDALVSPPGSAPGAYLLLPLTDSFADTLRAAPLSEEIYVAPNLTLDGTYQVGGPWLHVNLGTKNAIARVVAKARGGGGLAGNYGVLYTVNVTLTNPTPQPRPIVLLFEAGAGEAAGIFTVNDGPSLLINPIYPPSKSQIAKFTLQPGEIRIVRVRTLPLSGSAYPAFLLAHAL